MKILVTGNMGYVGSVLSEELRRQYPGSYIVGFDTGYFSHVLTNSRRLPEVHVNEQHYGDLRRFPPGLLDGVDCIVHLAAISNDPIGNRFSAVTESINAAASAQIARMARDGGCARFVFPSSCSLYGSSHDGPRKESDPLNPLTAYACSKQFLERELADLASEDFMVTNLRFSTACGMSPRLRLDLVLNDFVASALTTGVVEILSDGKPWRPLIDVKDMVTAIMWAIVRDPADGVALSVNVGRNDWNYQVRDVAHAVRDVLGDVDVHISENAMPDKRSYKVDFTLYEQIAPDHQPKVHITQSIAELKKGLEGMGFANRGFRNSEYMRLQVLLTHISERRLTPELYWV